MTQASKRAKNPAEQILLLLHRVIPGWKFR
jgi:hypothetical protein